ncbi:unnamed protein product [Callosobruchus maculatus]|uniref:E3 ubiquitin-protein ligase Sina-like RING finger domain-containing protein n=1 Tax=Callosobruchus maculatus TaxID=64391 RepID=A0A653DLY5_CALMS|nr:unnamed protein product [Callosobruchus maculatus]
MEGNGFKIRNTESDEKLERDIVTHYVCPGCEKYIFRPIRQCCAGHIFCSDCFYHMKRCIVCYNPKSDLRAYTLERIQATLRFHCKYRKVGCNFFETAVLVQAHQDKCEYSKFACPLGFTKCTWCDRLTVVQGKHQYKLKNGYLPSRFRKHPPSYPPK